MAIDVYSQARQAEHSITGKRWCMQCQMTREVKDGVYLVVNKGKNQRWECFNCNTNRLRRAGK